MIEGGAPGPRIWRYPGHVAAADAAEARATAAAIKEPLKLEPWRVWDPADAWPVDPNEPIPAWGEPILAAGPRSAFEFEQIIPGEEPDAIDDPIIEAGDRARAGDREGARRQLRALTAADPCCLDAHAHLGWLAFEFSAKRALPNYQAGVAIAERSLPEGFSAVLPWGTDRQPAVPPLPARPGAMSLASRTLRQRHTDLRVAALAQPDRQPGCPRTCRADPESYAVAAE